MTLVICLLIVGWVAAATIGTQAYFRGEQRKPIHLRNWNNKEFDGIAKTVTGYDTDYGDRVPSTQVDAYSSGNLSG